MNRMIEVRKTIVVIATLLIVGVQLFAGTDGTIRGQVSDVEGAPLPGAQIYIKSLEVGAVADVNGNYIILNVPVGTYSVSVMMMGYQKQTVSDVIVQMDRSMWLNFKLPVESQIGDEVNVVAERPLVDKASTTKKVTVDSEAITSLPMRDLNELYTLQSGVIKVESRRQGIPDHEERGLEEIHVRGGRAGEIAYMIDGLYIRNPIYGGIGNGTRLNLFAVREFDWQPGGFNAEYGDAISAVSNMHTNSGGNKFRYQFKYSTSSVGALMGSDYDDLRGYNDYNIGFGGTVPVFKKLSYWFSGQFTTHESYQVYEFDDIVYQLLPGQENYLDPPDENDPGYQSTVNENRNNMVQPWDQVAGFRGFGHDRTSDIFGKLSYKFSPKLIFNLSYWNVDAHRKGFNPRYLYWDEGQNELFRNTERISLEINHSLTSKTFYTVRTAQFTQEQFQGVRWQDSDSDGYPDWFEWRHSAGPDRSMSNPYDPDVVPYYISENGDTLHYNLGGLLEGRSGWFFGADPGVYNWEVAEEFTDQNGNGVWDTGEPWEDLDEDGEWDGPELVEALQERDGSYWLAPEMYESYQNFSSYSHVLQHYLQDPYLDENPDSLDDVLFYQPGGYNYYMPSAEYGGVGWFEGHVFGGHDRFYSTSNAVTRELRFDITSQITNEFKLRSGIDLKSHRLNFYEIISPWLGTAASIQTFAEFWEDTGPDGLLPTDLDYVAADPGEGNGRWEEGEEYTDANKNGKWDDFREPIEFAAYIQNTFEVPWMVINAGVRVDAVNYKTQVWADPSGDFSPGKPWYFSDVDEDGIWDEGEEEVSEFAGLAHQEVLFTDAQWFYKVSPRLGISHIITDRSTFTFNYGVYYQTPVYMNVYLNTSRLEDPEELFQESGGTLGNATMGSQRSQSYEMAYNVQVGRHWRYSIAAWVRDMDQWVTFKNNRSGVYEYQVFDNGDYGGSKGVDFTLERRGRGLSGMMQYTYSVAKANKAHDWAAEGTIFVDAPSQEFLMPYDRTHDLTLSLYTVLPFGIRSGITGFYQSGYPYTPYIYEAGDRNPSLDIKNQYSKRSPDYINFNLSFSKGIKYGRQNIMLGLNVFNLFDIRNSVDIWPLTGKADDPGSYYTNYVGLPGTDPNEAGVKAYLSNSYFDQPWYFSSPRQINFFVRFEFE
ncbi:MAG: TonB-dependent receptor [Candidatus Marinimicrobia bacterium]|nr:TonB-dependent receptor [Candidatus Neomarinimicrobiota bacterium]